MPIVFRRRNEIQKPDDPGAKLINRIITFGLIFFLGYSVLNEKRTLENTKLVWQASLTNNVTNHAEQRNLVENDTMIFKIDEADIEKIKSIPRDVDGKIPLFTVRINQILQKQPESPAPATAKPNLPAEAAKKAPTKAKTNVTP